MAELTLADGFRFEDLYEAEGLERLDRVFVSWLAAEDGDLAERLAAARGAPGNLEAKTESAFLLELAPHLESFLGRLFGIEAELRALAAAQDGLAPLYHVKRQFVQRRAGKQVKPDEARALDGEALARELAALGAPPDDERAFARQVAAWMDDEEGSDSSDAVAEVGTGGESIGSGAKT